MADPPPLTMAASEAAAPSRAQQQARTAFLNAPEQQVTKSLVTREFDLTFRAFFPSPTAPMKFNPAVAMRNLFRTILKDESSLVLRNAANDNQIVLASDSFPIGENEFKKFFKISNLKIAKHSQTHVCIGCHVLSDRTLGNIKFKSNESNLLNWLKKEKVFLEADSLGIDRPVTIGYLTKIDPTITHLSNLRETLVNQLLLIDIEADLAVELAPHLKDAQLEAMSNGDDYVPILPNFEVYRTRLTHGRAPSQVITDVIGVKGTPRDAKLLSEFFTRMASATSNDIRNGTFIPTGAVHLLGPTTYEQVLKANNFFLNQVATIPVNLEYGAWFAIIDTNQTSETEPTSLYEHLLRKPWFLRIESVAKKKCLIVTTKPNLPEARDWIDSNLEPLIRKSIPPGMDPPSSHMPRRLDKPVYSATCKTYADILKQQFSLAPNASSPTATDHTRPPRKRQATVIDYDSDSMEYPPLSTTTANHSTTTSTCIAKPDTISTTPSAFNTELLLLKQEIAQLKTTISTAVEQLLKAIASIHVIPSQSPSQAMDIENTTTTMNPSNQYTHATDNHQHTDFSATICELRNDTATITDAMRDLCEKYLPHQSNSNTLNSSVT